MVNGSSGTDNKINANAEYKRRMAGYRSLVRNMVLAAGAGSLIIIGASMLEKECNKPYGKLLRQDSVQAPAAVREKHSVKVIAGVSDEFRFCKLNPLTVVKVAEMAGFTRDEAITATAIAISESHLNPKAIHINGNGSVDRGLWQINNRAWSDFPAWRAYDVEKSAKMALHIYREQGWSGWATWNNGMAQEWIAPLRKYVKAEGLYR